MTTIKPIVRFFSTAFLRSTDIDYNDDFGVAVAIAGDRIVVGAQHECSESTGVNGEPYHWAAPESGAAYTFVRSTDNIWRQEACIKASNTGPQDEFGRAVAILGNMVIVGAHGEDSPAKGVNQGDQADNSSVDAGAVYIFTGIPTVIASQLDDVNPSTAAQVDFKVTFSEPVTGVDGSDFATVTSNGITGAHVTGVSGGPTTYLVTVDTGSGDGTMRLDVNDNDSILGERNVPLGGAGVGNASFTQGESYLVRLRKQIFRSQAALDGWVLESGEKTTVGGTINSTGSLIVGDDDLNRQYRSVVSFDTSSLPDTANIISGTFKLRKESVVGTDPFTTNGPFNVALCKGFFGATSALEIDDFEFYRLTYCSSAHPEYHVNGGVWYDIVQGSVERPRINRIGLTQYRMEFLLGDNNDESADYITFYSGDASTASYRPALVVEYYVP